MIDWQYYLNKANSFEGLDITWGTPHQAATLLTWVESVDEFRPHMRYETDHPPVFADTPAILTPLPDLPNHHVIDAGGTRIPGARLAVYAPLAGNIESWEPLTPGPYEPGDLCIVFVVVAKTALDAMVTAKQHLPLMRKYVNPLTPDDPAFDPQTPFTPAQVGVIADWFNDLGANENPRYPTGLSAAQVANFCGQFVPAITSPLTMATWMQTEPRYRTIAVLAQIFAQA